MLIPAVPFPLTEAWLDLVAEQCLSSTTSGAPPTLVDGKCYYYTDSDRLYLYDGTGSIIIDEPAQSWTPTWTNLTVGNGTQTSYYTRSGGFCNMFLRLVWGSTTSIGGAVSFAPPINAANAYDLDNLQARYADASTVTTSPGFGSGASTSSVALFTINTAGTYAVSSALDTPASEPFGAAWTTSDQILVFGRYRMTTRYS